MWGLILMKGEGGSENVIMPLSITTYIFVATRCSIVILITDSCLFYRIKGEK